MRIHSKLIQNNGILVSFSLVFWGFFFASLAQGWKAFSLLVLPLSQYVMFIWLQLVSHFQSSSIIQQYQIKFLSLGNTNVYSRKFFYCSILELVILVTMGIEAIYHPQLVNNYFVLYLIPIVLISIFSTFYGTHDLCSSSKVQISQKNQHIITIRLDTSKIKWISQGSLLLTVFLSVVWILLSILGYFNIFAFSIHVPFSAERLRVSSFLVVVVLFVILHPIIILSVIHRLILKETQLHLRTLPEKPRRVFSVMIQNYVLIPRFFKAC